MDKWRTPEAQEYRKLYQTKQWRHLREVVLLRDAFQCQRCGCFLKRGKTQPQSAVIHHIKPHKGDLDLFYDPGNLVSVCKKCHDGPIQAQESRGYDTTISETGWPEDPKHPANVQR